MLPSSSLTSLPKMTKIPLILFWWLMLFIIDQYFDE